MQEEENCVNLGVICLNLETALNGSSYELSTSLNEKLTLIYAPLQQEKTSTFLKLLKFDMGNSGF